jgi:hypothetical protein
MDNNYYETLIKKQLDKLPEEEERDPYENLSRYNSVDRCPIDPSRELMQSDIIEEKVKRERGYVPKESYSFFKFKMEQ